MSNLTIFNKKSIKIVTFYQVRSKTCPSRGGGYQVMARYREDYAAKIVVR